MPTVQDRLLQEFKERDSYLLQASDAIDVKASIVLVLDTFVSSAVVFVDRHPRGWALAFVITIGFFLSTALIAAIAALWPRTYIYADPYLSLDRIKELEQVFADYAEWHEPENVTDQEIDRQLTLDELDWCQRRIEHNQEKNQAKFTSLAISFYTTTAAVILGILGTAFVGL